MSLAFGACLACAVALAIPLDAAADTLGAAGHTVWRVGERGFKTYPRALAQTSDGLLWLGSEDGLVRFDGDRFMPWQPPPGQSLPSASIVRLVGARDGSLWIGASRGLARLKDAKLTEYPRFAGTFIAALIERRDGSIWIGTNAGLDGSAVLCAVRELRIECHGSAATFGRFVSALYEDSNGTLWVGAATGLWRWDDEHPQFFRVPHAFPEIHAITEDAHGELLIAMNQDLRRFAGGRLDPYIVAGLPTPLEPTALLRDSHGRLWVGRKVGGLVAVVEGVTQSMQRRRGLSGDFVSSLFEDRDGNLWTATLEGLDRFRDLAVSTFSADDGAVGARLTSVVASAAGGMWVGSIGGLSRLIDEPSSSPRLEHTLDMYVASLHEDRTGRLWISSPQGLFSLRNGVSTRVTDVGEGYIHAIAEDAEGNLWVADQLGGLLRLQHGAVVERIPWSTFGGRIARSLAGDPHRPGVWAGFFQGGVARFADGHVRESYPAGGAMGQGLVSSVVVGTDGVVWAATEHGLAWVKNGAVRRITDAHGLPCSRVHWAVEGDGDAMWLYTACGLLRISRREVQASTDGPLGLGAVTVYDDADGVPGQSELGSYGPKVAKSGDGRIWFTTHLGLSVVNPKRLPRTPVPPSTFVERVTVDGVAYDVRRRGELPSNVRDLRIEYGAISPGVPQKLRFRYKLEGRDLSWVDAATRREAFYTDLPPNRYRFRVMASHANGSWKEQEAVWEFSIAPAFHRRPQFWVAVAVLGALALWALHRRRLRQVATAINMRFEERLAERTRIAQELHDTLLQEFVGASLQLHLVADDMRDHPARPRLDSVLQRITQGLAEGRQSLSGLRTPLTVDDLDQRLSRDAEFFRGDRDTVLHVVVEGTKRPLRPLVRDEMYRILREALANAFRHSDATRVNMTFEYTATYVRVRVADNGCGMEPEILKYGRTGHFGMLGMRERGDLIGATLKVSSRSNFGTEVDLLVPAESAFEYAADSRRRDAKWWRHAFGAARAALSRARQPGPVSRRVPQ